MVRILNVTYNMCTGKQLHSLRGFAEMVINFASYTAVFCVVTQRSSRCVATLKTACLLACLRYFYKALFTLLLHQIVFAPSRKSYRTGLLFTHKNGCGGAIFVTKRSERNWIVTYQIGFFAILRCSVNMSQAWSPLIRK